jgi:hypothetical protein
MTMTTITLRDKLAALEAERDLLRAQLAKARHHKKPYEEMTTEEYRATLNKLGLSIVASAEHLGLSPRQPQRYANRLSPTRSRSSYASPSESASPPTISRPSDLTRTRALVPSSSRQE